LRRRVDRFPNSEVGRELVNCEAAPTRIAHDAHASDCTIFDTRCIDGKLP
jgi:hypothetical protein